ncbi:MAG: hypothetical protein ACLQIQ_00210 [Beijerinckiaceae bacterium]
MTNSGPDDKPERLCLPAEAIQACSVGIEARDLGDRDGGVRPQMHG